MKASPTCFGLHKPSSGNYSPRLAKITFQCYGGIRCHSTEGDRGYTVVKALCYISEGRCFDPKWCHWNFSLTYSFQSHYGPGVDSASNRNEYQEYFLGVNAAGA
jgi:hypothetical protein